MPSAGRYTEDDDNDDDDDVVNQHMEWELLRGLVGLHA
jgi:hypothetical protein